MFLSVLSLPHDLVLDPIFPPGAVALLAVAMLVLTAAVYRWAGAGLSGMQRAVLLLLRLAGVALVLLLLLQPSRVETIPPPETQRVTLLAIDDSQSMAQRDVAQGSRSEAARAILAEAELAAPDGSARDESVRLFEFAEDAAPLVSTAGLKAEGASTRFHRSIVTMLGSLRAHEGARALVVLSDGHDFELVNPAKTGFVARQRQTPIFAVPIGKQGKVRDVSARITSYQPYTYVKQKARIGAALRLIGCELETLTVDLLRGEKVVQTKKVAAGEESEVSVSFEVVEPAVGQYEYEIFVRPLEREIDGENNHAFTYLNVIDQQFQVLFLEGAPYWDTTFLSRSLLRNDKMNVDSIVQYAKGKARRVRKKAGETELKIPATVDDWRRYDVVVLGRSIENLLGVEDVRRLEDYVRKLGGAVIFARGPAFGSGPLVQNELEPVIWGAKPAEHVRLFGSREGQALAPFRTIQEQAGPDAVPPIIAAYPVYNRKPLAATLAIAQGPGGEPTPGMVHRRFGDGQVLSVGVDGLWRWAFNAKVEGANTVFDRFWDQMLLWLMAGRDFLPAQKFVLRGSTANVPLGEKIYFRVLQRDGGSTPGGVPLAIEHGGREIARTTVSAADPAEPGKLTAEFLPARTGKFTAVAHFSDSTTQRVRFIVYDENLEQTEVATDTGYLRKLCEASGGRLLATEELGKVLDELKTQEPAAVPTTRMQSVWDRWWICWTIAALLGADWYLRRRWGLC
jgi:hypothetical protein